MHKNMHVSKWLYSTSLVLNWLFCQDHTFADINKQQQQPMQFFNGFVKMRVEKTHLKKSLGSCKMGIQCMRMNSVQLENKHIEIRQLVISLLDTISSKSFAEERVQSGLVRFAFDKCLRTCPLDTLRKLIFITICKHAKNIRNIICFNGVVHCGIDFFLRKNLSTN